MLDFQAVRDQEITFDVLVSDLTPIDLADLTNEMVDTIFELIHTCQDEDVTFVPQDPEAHDPFAEDEKDIDLPWTLGHIIVHTTASAEESAFLAAELARGVKFHGRSRSEIPWETIDSIEHCRQRLEESRRMRLASLETWPDQPYLGNIYEPWAGASPVNAIGRFVYGLSHDDSHLAQIVDVVRQALAVRSE